MRQLVRKHSKTGYRQSLSPPKAEKALELRLKGWRLMKIADFIGVSISAVSNSISATIEESNKRRLDMADTAIHKQSMRFDYLMAKLFKEMDEDPDIDLRAQVETIRKLIDSQSNVIGLMKVRVEGEITFGDRRRQLEEEGLPELNEEGDDL